ncbi:9634_t:CDS:2, partial [Ambispora leptoticha]
FLHNKTLLAVDPDHPRHKGLANPPLHHECQGSNHSWPNDIGDVTMDSKLMCEKKLRHWTFICQEAQPYQARLRKRVRNPVDEAHKKTARTFDIIVLPTFDSTRMSRRRQGRRLNNRTVRKMGS